MNIQRVVRVILVCLLVAVSVPQSVAAQTLPLDVTAYALPGERVFTIQPGLRYANHVYEVHYFTTGSYDRQDAVIFTFASQAYFERQQITGLLVTADGKTVVSDEKTLRTIFSLYPSAYLLYDGQAPNSLGLIDDAFVDDLRKVTNNPLFVEQQIKAP